MAKLKKHRRESAWLSIRQLADALDVSIAYCRREVLRRTPEDAIRRDEGMIKVHARSAIEGWLSDRIESRIMLDMQIEVESQTEEEFAVELAACFDGE